MSANTIAVLADVMRKRALGFAARGDAIFNGAIFAEELQSWAERVAGLAPDWRPIDTAPKDRMFIWAFPKEGRWSIGLAYRNVTGGWSDAYGDREAPQCATHWAALPEPPVSS